MSKIALYIAWPGGMTVVIRNATNKIVGRSKPGPKGTPLFRRQAFRLPDDPDERLSLTTTIFRTCSPSNLPIPVMLRELEDGSLLNYAGVDQCQPLPVASSNAGQAVAHPPSQQDVISQLKEFDRLTKANIQTLCSSSANVTAAAIKALEKKGLIKYSKDDQKYHLA